MTMIVFSHGLESGPWGTKIRAMADCAQRLGYETDSIDYQGMREPQERVDKLVGVCASIDDVILVGSSMGGHVATAAAPIVNAKALFVLAPAYYMPGYEDITPPAPEMPMCIVHGWHDDIVPVENSIRYAKQALATLHLVDGDHRLTGNIKEINEYFSLFLHSLR